MIGRVRLALLALTLLACSSAPVNPCTPGANQACTCPDGSDGAQVCRADGTFAVCVCEPSIDAGPTPANDAGSDAGGSSDAGSTDAGTSDAGTVDAGMPTSGPGHLVLIGDWLLQPFDAGQRILVNAIALSEATGSIRVLEYVEFPAAGWDPRTLRPVITEGLASSGRTATFTELTEFFRLTDAISSADVFLIYAQEASADTLHTIARAWNEPLLAFLDRGGVIVVLDRVPFSLALASTSELVDGAGLLTISNVVSTSSSPAVISMPLDPVAAGVPGTFSTLSSTVAYPGISGATDVAQTRDDAYPIVVHRIHP